MLVLSRQRDESVMIGEDVEVRVVDVRGDKVRLGFVAPRDVAVHRKEVYDLIRRENASAAQVMPADVAGLRRPPPRPTMRLVPQEAAVVGDPFLHAALDEARISLSEGGLPIGAVLVRNGQIIGRGHDRRVQYRNPVAHAEVECLARAGRQQTYADTTLYTTLTPGFLCVGAIVQFGIPKVVVGDAANDPSSATFGEAPPNFLRAHGVEVVNLYDPICVELLATFIRERPDVWNEVLHK